MKTVVSNSQCAHLWAHQAQGHANSDSMRFDGPKLYSYAALIGNIVKHKSKQCVLLTDRRWSVTTSTHQGIASRAVSHIQPHFYVSDLGSHGAINHKENLRDYTSRINELGKCALRSRLNRGVRGRQLKLLVNEANAYSKFFGLKMKFKVPTEINLKKLEREEREAIKKNEEQQRQARLRAREDDRPRFEAWQSGQHDHCPYSWRDSSDVRLRVKGDTVQTSMGAEVPLAHCRAVLQLVRSGQTYQHNGHSVHVGHFRIDSIDASGTVKAGCHTIKREEIERIATQLGW